MRWALAAEWTKLRSVRSTPWLLLGIVALTVMTDVISIVATRCPGGACHYDPGKVSLVGVEAGQAVVAVLGVITVCGEYGTGMIRVTFAAMPRRWLVVAAKTALLAGLVLAAAAVAVLASVLTVLSVPGVRVADGAMVRAAAGSVLYLGLIAILAAGVAAIVRDGAVAIGTVLGLLYLFPALASALGPSWQRHIEQFAPMLAGLDIQATAGLRALPLTPWQGLGVLASWAAGAVLLGALVTGLRDA